VAQFHTFPRSDGSTVEIAVTEKSDGDFHIDALDVEARRAAVMSGEWAVVRQVHGRRIVHAEPHNAPEADALMTDAVDQPIAVQGADCAPVAFVTDSGPVAVAHVGWRGLEAGVLDTTIEQLQAHGATVGTVLIGPHIGPECYEFGSAELERLTASLGPEVASTTTEGTPALDVGQGIVNVLRERHGIVDIRPIGSCTACADGGWSHRARQEPQRHALVARITAGPSHA
jgi:YfiH family protein